MPQILELLEVVFYKNTPRANIFHGTVTTLSPFAVAKVE